jgi:histidine kinase
MSAGVAHELNQPLSVIKSASSFLSFLAKKVIEKHPTEASLGPSTVAVPADVLKSLADEIDRHVDRASCIIQHLREFGRRSDLTRTEVDVNLCIREVFMMVGRQLEGRGIKAHLHLDEPLPPIMADKNRIEQVFINLVLNARDAIEARQAAADGQLGEMGLHVRSRLEGGHVTVAFGDTGCGIPEAILPRIFDPFFTTKEVGKGTGLGLSISYGIVRDYGGRIQVESVVGQGTTFTLSFPARTQEAS